MRSLRSSAVRFGGGAMEFEATVDWAKLWRLATLSCLMLSCQESTEQPAVGPAGGGPVQQVTAAVVGHERVSLDELDSWIGHELYALRSQALRSYLAQRLLRAEAQSRNISVAELRRQEIEAKVVEPTEDELEAEYLMAQREGRVPAEEQYAKVAEGFRRTRRKMQLLDLESSFFANLSQKHGVRINLDGLGRPRVQTRSGGPEKGQSDAPIVLVEYTDYADRFCALANPTMKKLLTEFPSDIRVVVRHKVNPEHLQAFQAAQAALCADAQGKYWEYRDRLFDAQEDQSMQALHAHAKAVQLDVEKFSTCLEQGDMGGLVTQDTEEARRGGFEGSPAFSLAGTKLSGAHDFDTFADLIRTELDWVRKEPKQQVSLSPPSAQ